ncbi:Protein of unknown function [Salinibacterium xinjiangense]|uniref:DUF429 domain-containing protein n=2 Tax=Salinibacterium xinjiangense TaxID=386302 RepID=A0A2C8ZVU3_9MICO|nr:Protein of unknown function [Salinibacterium xinjiangense]
MFVGHNQILSTKESGTKPGTVQGSTAAVQQLRLGINDSEIMDLSVGAEKVGIDCPFGWPDELVDFIAAHSRREVAPRELAGSAWRRRLAYRDTDRFVRERVGRWPLSVSTDRLGPMAMHCVELLSFFEDRGDIIVDRSGADVLVEVYPRAALRVWGVAVDGYKTELPARASATENLQVLAPWLDLQPAHVALMSRSDDAFDAVVAALVARAHARGQTYGIPDHSRERAKREGWMALPLGTIGELVHT